MDQEDLFHVEGVVREITCGRSAICRNILDDLPRWFGIRKSVDAYVCDVESMLMYGFWLRTEVLGFLSVMVHNPLVAEAYVLGVKRQ